MLKVSIVTISFNQAAFLERAMRSVLDQDYPNIEYIVVDPGSTDGSRDIIEKYRPRISSILFAPDHGAADGLNKGFACATGDIFGFLNSDDVMFPGTVREAVEYLGTHAADVVSGHALIIDAGDTELRIAYSDRFSLGSHAYGACVLIQPSTFFTRDIFQRTQGFNVSNRSNWDGELFVDMALAGARFALVNEIWSGYRLHEESITASGNVHELVLEHHRRMFRKIKGREECKCDRIIGLIYRLNKYKENPRSLYERVARGPIYRKLAK